MSSNGQEIEAKFYVLQLDRIITRLQELEARLIQARVLETNLRFDLPDGSLRSRRRALRLRRDTESRLTFKGGGHVEQGVLSREEIEFVVGDFDKARQFLEALGYQQIMLYEKYRTTYALSSHGECLVMLDEMPFGNFIEIEGDSVDQIRGVAELLQLRWDTAIHTSYAGMFEIASHKMNLTFRDLSFRNFEGITATATDLGVRAADG